METGYKLNDIDEMDIYYYFKLLAHEDKRRQAEQAKVADKLGI
jgi:hypothetical protein